MADARPKSEAVITFNDDAGLRPLGHPLAALYGIGSIGTATFVIVPQLYLLFFMTETLAIPAGYATLVLLLPKLWEFIFDPAVGGFSDRLSERWGRRLPPMLLGAPLFGVGFALLFARLCCKPGDWPIEGSRWLSFIGYAASFSSRSLMKRTASVSASAPTPKARSTIRASPSMSRLMLNAAACPLRRTRMTSKPLMVA